MGTGSYMSKPLKILIEFRKYEKKLYKYFFGFPDRKDDMEFYLIPKAYIDYFISLFKVSKFSEELDQLILYLESPDDNNNSISEIRQDLIKKLNNEIYSGLTMEKINNEDMLEKSGKISFVKKNKEGSFIPLTKNIWEIFSGYYGYDVILFKTGFISEREIFILIEEEMRIDCFFLYYHTKDLVYHYCFILDNFSDYKTLKNHFKRKEHQCSAMFLIEILKKKIDIKGANIPQKLPKTKIPKSVINTDNFDVTIYFIDSFKFNDSEKNFEYFESNDNESFLNYKQQNIDIINSINSFNN